MQQTGSVIVVFKTHLDIGFTDFAANVVDKYFTEYIPRAMTLAGRLRARGGPERFVWTTGSWLIHEFLERAPAAGRKRMEQAILAGDIAWHALPFTTHTELMDGSLFRFGLGLSRELDQRFGRKTIAAKMTDVPGHTRSMVPYLAEAGVQFLHLGVNPACPAPAVPPVFRWRAPGGEEVVVMYGEGAYGETHAIPGVNAHLYLAHSNDNAGPPRDEAEVLTLFARLAERFPKRRIEAGTMDVFARALVKAQPRLPVIEQEIGDTWIHGAGSDPLKIARFRQLCRLRAAWERADAAGTDNPRCAAFSRRLLLVAEHTWGMDEKTHLPASGNNPAVSFEKEATYAPAAFRRARRRRNFREFEKSWAEQRAYIDEAVQALGATRFGREARQALRELAPQRPARTGYARITGERWTFETAQFTVRLDAQTGALTGLTAQDGTRLAGGDHPLGAVAYQTFAEADYQRFIKQYCINQDDPGCRSWAVPDLSKPGIDRGGAVSAVHAPVLRWAGRRSGKQDETLRIEAVFAADLCRRFGAPRLVTIEYRFPRATPHVEIDLQWFGKPACRLPEALWFSCVPAGVKPKSWRMDKMGHAVSPLDVVRLGNRNLHGLGDGLRAELQHGGRLHIASLDAPLVAPGAPRLLRFDNTQPPLAGGMHFNLYNNVWGTNFPMWYADDARFRFEIAVDCAHRHERRS